MPYLGGRPRPRRDRGRRKSAVSRRAWPTTVMPRATAQRTRRAHEPRVDEKDVGAKLVQHGANEDLGQLAAVKSDRRETRGRLRRRPDDRGERDEVLRQDMGSV